MGYDVVIVGSGIVGLATAYQLQIARRGLKVLILEKEEGIAQHQTSHNSGVIHSGLYYKPGSLKARNCINGYNKLIKFCRKEDIPFELCGKIVVATDERELAALEKLYQTGTANGLKNLKLLGPEELKEYEPHASGIRAIAVPQTGIIDYSRVAAKLAQKFQEMGGLVQCNRKVCGFVENSSAIRVQTEGLSYDTKLVVNCAGLYSDKIAGIGKNDIDFKIIPFRGEYYKLTPEKQGLVRNLIYPVPDPSFPFLGVHFTRMISGGVEAGPNAVLAFKREGYSKSDFSWADFSESISWPGFQHVMRKYWKTGIGEYYRSYSKKAFTKALQRLIPELKEKDLVPGGSGVRAQACYRSGGLLDDFLILEDKRTINVGNAPSPAATSSLSIGETVANLALARFD
jgi:L-2-hydroxyglutarate oxidase